jgi:hypothetical protein
MHTCTEIGFRISLVLILNLYIGTLHAGYSVCRRNKHDLVENKLHNRLRNDDVFSTAHVKNVVVLNCGGGRIRCLRFALGDVVSGRINRRRLILGGSKCLDKNL